MLTSISSTKIQFVDIRRQYQNHKPEIDDAILGAVERADFVLGEDTVEFENEFAAFNRIPFCVGVANGTDALHLALLALGLGPGMT